MWHDETEAMSEHQIADFLARLEAQVPMAAPPCQAGSVLKDKGI